ncbi:uncharacterized protein J7T54_003982 [Emericellopsis cladophorae]|uniref:Btz domain-containing protein n=1 Tax=Emericellopsis cladophorae TaxID=2686198 RepID=A0A9Q0BEC5_9HYPO|nr:uncharacterized protein J7T54_003982 [Emericellopsis cladophorae]KAI6781716.1 hypothetical protein J7T54_003982 [Emericellopsis cladophorae]
MAAARRRKIGHRRRVEDEGEDEGGPEHLDLDDDSLSDASIATDDHDADNDSDTSNVDEVVSTSPTATKPTETTEKVASKADRSSRKLPVVPAKTMSDTTAMMHGMALDDESTAQELHFDETQADVTQRKERQGGKHADLPGPPKSPGAPVVVSSTAATRPQMHPPGDPTTTLPWAHDMHETVAARAPGPSRQPRHLPEPEGPPNGNGFIPTREPNSTPINRILSTEKHIGNTQVRVSLPGMAKPLVKPGLAVKQYTKLPDHRPPLRRDKPVRISLPDRPPRYIYPAIDRSFIFIPRAMRPNQQRGRGKGRSGAMGSAGGFSRRTSVFGGSYYGSMYSPSVAMSRRSSFAQDRDAMFSPAASITGPPAENVRPVVRLPPPTRSEAVPAMPNGHAPFLPINGPPPQFQENRTADGVPMHQPRPKKNISVADIESPSFNQGPAFQQAFHQQMPLQMGNGHPKENHVRQHSYLSQRSSGTPLSQIPERAIHAAPFQPNPYGQAVPQQPYYGQQEFQGPAPPTYSPYYGGSAYNAPDMAAPVVPGYGAPSHHGAPSGYAPPATDPAVMQANDPAQTANGPLVAQEANGMVYYYNTPQPGSMNPYQHYPAAQPYQPTGMGMGGMVTPSPDGYYYPQGGQNMVYYPQ